jgi:excisionase family DNA binding protein
MVRQTLKGGEKMLAVEEAYYTPKEVAQRLKVSRKSIYRWLESGDLRAVKFGRDYRIMESDLEDFIRERRTRRGER